MEHRGKEAGCCVTSAVLTSQCVFLGRVRMHMLMRQLEKRNSPIRWSHLSPHAGALKQFHRRTWERVRTFEVREKGGRFIYSLTVATHSTRRGARGGGRGRRGARP
ncbi:hypothetical protein EVAR_20177_1 [Eumeta japonica]|uniref:Uncharacterized protein n=1 Tax=Eumeta variegata TaxID=151549 RepID=A0A4C1UTT5_EUMVA|nr:hypothetical protein EVAR_20177_1 [Eumeta japonica]